MSNDYPTTFIYLDLHGSGENPNYRVSPYEPQREALYGITGYPTVVFDGVLKCVGAYQNDTQQYNWFLSQYNARMAAPTDVSVDVGGVLVAGQTFDITARVAIDAGGQSKTMRIWFLHALDNYPYSADHRYGMCLRVPAPVYQDVTLAPGNSVDITKQFTFDATSWAQQSDIKMVVWAQATTTPYTVHNAHMMSWPFTELPGTHHKGDLNCDGLIDFGDIDPFVLALSDPAAYQQQFPNCDRMLADINGDGSINFADIDPFVALLSGG